MSLLQFFKIIMFGLTNLVIKRISLPNKRQHKICNGKSEERYLQVDQRIPFNINKDDENFSKTSLLVCSFVLPQ